MTTKLFKDGDRMGIWTDAKEEYDFINEIATLWDDLISRGWCCPGKTEEGDGYGCDWLFQLQIWLPQVVSICCKYRGYKSDVEEAKVLYCGNIIPRDFMIEVDNKGGILSRREPPMDDKIGVK